MGLRRGERGAEQGRNMGLRRGAVVWGCAGAQRGAEQGGAWGCAGAQQRVAAQGFSSVGLRRGAAACGRAGVQQRGAAQGCSSVGLRRGAAAWGCAEQLCGAAQW